MKSILFILMLIPGVAIAKPAGPKCVDQVVKELLSEMLSPCGRPKQDPDSKKEILYMYYSDRAWGSPIYDPNENCGSDSSGGLGIVKVQYHSLRHGDCKLVNVTDISSND